MKWHFLSSLAFVSLLTFGAMNENRSLRIILLIPELILFYITLVLFAVDYDQRKKDLSKKHKK